MATLRTEYRLTGKELSVAQLTYADRTRKEIAKALLICPGTVQTYCARLHEKTGVHDRVALVHKVNAFFERCRNHAKGL